MGQIFFCISVRRMLGCVKKLTFGTFIWNVILVQSGHVGGHIMGDTEEFCHSPNAAAMTCPHVSSCSSGSSSRMSMERLFL
jgi:hypothetical protein